MMTRPGPVNFLQQYAVARFPLRKSVVTAVTCFSGFSIPWRIRLCHMGTRALLPLMMILVLICLCVPVSAGSVRGPLKLDGTTIRYDLKGHLEVYEDKTGATSLDSVQSKGFDPTDKAVPNFGFTGSAYWIKFSVENATSEAQSLFLQITNPYLDFIYFFVKSDRDSTIERYPAGTRVPLDDKVAGGLSPVQRLVFAPGEAKTIYLRAKSETPLRIPLILSTEEGYRHDQLKRYMLLGIFYGVLGLLIIFNIFGWSILRQRAYFYYILLLIGLGANQMGNDGLIPQVTIFSQPERLLHLFTSGIGLTFVFNIIFVSSFMDARAKYPTLYRVLDSTFALGTKAWADEPQRLIHGGLNNFEHQLL